MSNDNHSTCKGCGAQILWVKSGDKSIPLDLKPPCYDRDGQRVEAFVSHFATCPQANRFSGSSKPAEGDGARRGQARSGGFSDFTSEGARPLLEFIQKLDNAATQGVTVNDWEAQFIESLLGRVEQYGIDRVKLSDKQRESIRKMQGKYRDQLGNPPESQEENESEPPQEEQRERIPF